MTDKRLIEVAFPLEQVSLDSVHEKNVRHGHISTLHIWPARRPLAACRAALIATLTPDPGNAGERQAIYQRMAGTVVETIKDERVGGRTVARRKRKTQGGILHWKRESENEPDLDWFRARIREAYGGRAPRVLDPFAGGGAIPLEAMRLGCGVTAVDLNPVAWFILKCTLHYPHGLAGETRPLPDFALRDRDFMAGFLKAQGVKGRALAPKRVLLTMTPAAERTGGVFGVEADVPQVEGNPAQRREHDRRTGAGTMSRSGAQCPLCQTIMTMQDLRLDGRAGRLGAVLTAVVVDGLRGKEYRLPTALELQAARVEQADLDTLYADIPFGLPDEPTPSQENLGMRVPRYGFDAWRTLFTNRQLLALGAFVQETRRLDETMAAWPAAWREAVVAMLTPTISRLADRGSTLATWTNDPEKVRSTFARFALPMVWDFVEACPLADTSGGFVQAVEWTAEACEHLLAATPDAPPPAVRRRSAAAAPDAADGDAGFDLICTDPPYYDAIPYSDLMDFFHVWLRRALWGLSPAINTAFETPLGPKWNAAANDGELIDDAARFDGDRAASKRNYEDGMARAFSRFHAALRDDGRLVIVFANKSPDAWETLVSALIRAGFVVDGSWPIQTERLARTRAMQSAALASSIWIVCRKRPAARAGWDTAVLTEMRENISQQLRDFWDAGIRGPDFVWAATGPALEAFSKYPVVKRADDADSQMTVSEFLRAVRRFVVDFVVGRVLTHDGDDEATSGLDDVTTYYLLHRNDFGLGDAPIGACILYAISCNLSDRDLTDRYDVLSRGARASDGEPDDDEADTDENASPPDSPGAGSRVRLKPWSRRTARSLGYRTPDGRPPPLIDQAHRLMHFWRDAEEAKVNDYLDERGLKRHALFARLLQALIELAAAGSDERAILESLSNHIAARGGVAPARQPTLQRLGEEP